MVRHRPPIEHVARAVRADEVPAYALPVLEALVLQQVREGVHVGALAAGHVLDRQGRRRHILLVSFYGVVGGLVGLGYRFTFGVEGWYCMVSFLLWCLVYCWVDDVKRKYI